MCVCVCSFEMLASSCHLSTLISWFSGLAGPKSGCITSYYKPFMWVAVSGLEGTNSDREYGVCKPQKDRVPVKGGHTV